jgi:hypothetical protein
MSRLLTSHIVQARLLTPAEQCSFAQVDHLGQVSQHGDRDSCGTEGFEQTVSLLSGSWIADVVIRRAGSGRWPQR